MQVQSVTRLAEPPRVAIVDMLEASRLLALSVNLSTNDSVFPVGESLTSDGSLKENRSDAATWRFSACAFAELAIKAAYVKTDSKISILLIFSLLTDKASRHAFVRFIGGQFLRPRCAAMAGCV